ncbi:MAG: cupin domain-containing protein [Deltaproteobacteria bacterium]|nr:cupin domain-containing protein [Deltaproteobacteria bacterium]
MTGPSKKSGLPEASPVRVADLVQYGDGAVVSRILLKNAAGNLTAFAFDKEQELSEHTAPFDAVVEILDGEADLTIGGKTVRANAGETVLMPAGVPHAVRAPGRFKMLLIMIRG